MSNPFAKAIRKHSGKDSSVAHQQALGKPQPQALEEEHKQFLQTVLSLIDSGTIDTKKPESFLNVSVYQSIAPELKSRTDQAIPNIISFLERIVDLHIRPETDESAEMRSLIESLWQAKRRIEENADVFVF